MREMLILTGPQGAGNHMWSKIFSLHPAVYGWKTLLDNYWEAHRFKEPFCEHWKDHDLLDSFDWNQSRYYFTSISCPLGILEKKWMPDVAGFAERIRSNGINVRIAVVGRDQTILEHQQQRVRHESTLPLFLEQLPKFTDPVFLSYELLYLYRQNYLKSLDLNIPVAWSDPRVADILESDANARYIHAGTPSILDHCNATGITLEALPR